MSTPTPRTDAAWAKTFEADDDQCRAGNAATDMRDECATLEIELTRLRAERDQLRAEVAEMHQSFAGNVHTDNRQLRAEVERLKSQVADPQQLHAHCLRTLNEGQIAHLFWERMTEIVNRAEKTEAAQTVALANWNGALERALKAEADLIALAQCHDDNCRGVVKIADDLSTEREKAERYRLASLKLDAELAAERARLDWVFRNCKVTADDYTTGNRDVYAIHDREDLGAAMKKGAK